MLKTIPVMLIRFSLTLLCALWVALKFGEYAPTNNRYAQIYNVHFHLACHAKNNVN